jgi:hypothetical protein
MEGVNNTFKPFLYWKYGPQDGALDGNTGSGLNNDPVPHLSNTIPASSLNPYNFYDRYGFGQISDSLDRKGYGQTIAIINAYGNPNIQSDLDTFCSQLGIPSTNVEVYYPNGLPVSNNSVWALETNLDVQYAHAMALSARIVLVVAPDAAFTSLSSCITYAVTGLGADVVSMSFGSPEISYFYNSGYDSIFANLSAVYIASAGDGGAQVNYPGSSPNVLSVGGTTLTGGTNESYAVAPGPYNEVGWFGSGGGVSLISPLPLYQVGWSSFPKRSVPDVAYNAGSFVSVYFTDPVTSEYGWLSVNGTSVGSPQWAAIAARKNASGSSLKYKESFNSFIYNIAKKNYANIFYDIKQGSNPLKTSYGYDLVSGLGSPKVYSILPPEPSSTPTRTQTRTPTHTPSSTPPNTPTPSVTPTYTPTNKSTPSTTPTYTPTISLSRTTTRTPTQSPSFTATPSNTKYLTPPTPTPTPLVTPSKTPLQTRVPIASQTQTLSNSLTPSVTVTPSATDSNISLPTQPPSQTPSNTRSATPTRTPTFTPTRTPTPSITRSQTPTPTFTSTNTPTPPLTQSLTPSETPTSTTTRTPTRTPTNTKSETPTPTLTPTYTQTTTQTNTPTLSQTATPTLSPTTTPTLTPSVSPGLTPTPTPTFTPTNTQTNTQTKTNTQTQTNTRTLTPTSTQTPTVTLTNTPTLTQTPTVTLTNTPTLTNTITRTPSPTVTRTPTLSPTLTPTATQLPRIQSYIWAYSKTNNSFHFIDYLNLNETYNISFLGGEYQGVERNLLYHTQSGYMLVLGVNKVYVVNVLTLTFRTVLLPASNDPPTASMKELPDGRVLISTGKEVYVWNDINGSNFTPISILSLYAGNYLGEPAIYGNWAYFPVYGTSSGVFGSGAAGLYRINLSTSTPTIGSTTLIGSTNAITQCRALVCINNDKIFSYWDNDGATTIGSGNIKVYTIIPSSGALNLTNTLANVNVNTNSESRIMMRTDSRGSYCYINAIGSGTNYARISTTSYEITYFSIDNTTSSTLKTDKGIYIDNDNIWFFGLNRNTVTTPYTSIYARNYTNNTYEKGIVLTGNPQISNMAFIDYPPRPTNNSYIYAIANNGSGTNYKILEVNPYYKTSNVICDTGFSDSGGGYTNSMSYDAERDHIFFLDQIKNLWCLNLTNQLTQIASSTTMSLSLLERPQNGAYYNNSIWMIVTSNGINFSLRKYNVTYTQQIINPYQDKNVPSISGYTDYPLNITGVGSNDFGDIAINANTGILYACNNDGYFYSINLNNLSTTTSNNISVIRDFGSSYFQLAFNNDYSILYGSEGGVGDMYIINTTTGVLTNIGYDISNNLVPDLAGGSSQSRNLGGMQLKLNI